MSGLDALVRRYLKIIEAGYDGPKAQKALKILDTAFTQTYWEGVEKIVDDIANAKSDDKPLSPKKRLLMDFGWLDRRLIQGARECQEDLLEEMLEEGEGNCLYLSEWLMTRWANYNLIQDIVSHEQSGDGDESDSGMSEVLRAERMRLHKLRGDIYGRLTPYLEAMPGLSPALVKSVVSGGLDDQLENLSLEVLRTGKLVALTQRNKLADVRKNILKMLQQQLKNHKFLPLVGALEGVANNLWDERQKEEQLLKSRQDEEGPIETVEAAAVKEVPGDDAQGEETGKHSDFLRSELYIVKSLMPIAAIEGKKFKTSPVLLHNRARITKVLVRSVFDGLTEVDPRLPGHPDVLLAPCEGSGFFEWDRDTLFIPIHPTVSAEDCVLNAIANYRIMMDMQGGRSIQNFYQSLGGSKADFKPNFIRDYRSWVLKVGAGNKGGIKEPVLDFFFKTLGPDVHKVPGPRHLLSLSSIEQQDKLHFYLDKLRAKKISPEESYELGILYWLARKLDNAAKLMEMSLSRGFKHDKVLVGLGFLNRQRGLHKVAANYFKKCRDNRGANIWYLLAQRETTSS